MQKILVLRLMSHEMDTYCFEGKQNCGKKSNVLLAQCNVHIRAGVLPTADMQKGDATCAELPCHDLNH